MTDERIPHPTRPALYAHCQQLRIDNSAEADQSRCVQVVCDLHMLDDDSLVQPKAILDLFMGFDPSDPEDMACYLHLRKRTIAAIQGYMDRISVEQSTQEEL